MLTAGSSHAHPVGAQDQARRAHAERDRRVAREVQENGARVEVVWRARAKSSALAVFTTAPMAATSATTPPSTWVGAASRRQASQAMRASDDEERGRVDERGEDGGGAQAVRVAP